MAHTPSDGHNWFDAVNEGEAVNEGKPRTGARSPHVLSHRVPTPTPERAACSNAGDTRVVHRLNDECELQRIACLALLITIRTRGTNRRLVTSVSVFAISSFAGLRRGLQYDRDTRNQPQYDYNKQAIKAEYERRHSPPKKEPQFQNEPQACGPQVARSGVEDFGLGEVDRTAPSKADSRGSSTLYVGAEPWTRAARMWAWTMISFPLPVGGRGVGHNSKSHDIDESVLYGERVEANEGENGFKFEELLLFVLGEAAFSRCEAAVARGADGGPYPGPWAVALARAVLGPERKLRFIFPQPVPRVVKMAPETYQHHRNQKERERSCCVWRQRRRLGGDGREAKGCRRRIRARHMLDGERRQGLQINTEEKRQRAKGEGAEEFEQDRVPSEEDPSETDASLEGRTKPMLKNKSTPSCISACRGSKERDGHTSSTVSSGKPKQADWIAGRNETNVKSTESGPTRSPNEQSLPGKLSD
ncbi:hypothetical protein DFH06DRAFT_1131358 [Mycena polygramma]|nr:hypothetical protein DFH06DRAFT_1131358 [Mycena polygramma]